jgi:hypothetical protein
LSWMISFLGNFANFSSEYQPEIIQVQSRMNGGQNVECDSCISHASTLTISSHGGLFICFESRARRTQ